MKKSTWAGVVIGCGCLGVGGLVLVAGGVGLWWMYGRVKGGDIEEVAALLPEDTTMLIGMRGFADLALEFGPALKAVVNDPVNDKMRSQVSEEAQKELGFDPMDAQAWANTGFDFTRPWAFAAQGAVDPDDADLFFFAPVADEKKALATVRGALDRQKVKVQDQTVGNYTFLIIDDEVAATVFEGFLVFAGSDRRGADPTTTLRVFVERDDATNLAKNEDFKAIRKTLGDEWHLFAWASGALLQEAMKDGLRELGPDWQNLGKRGAGYVSHLSNEKVTARAALMLEPNSPLAGTSRAGTDKLGASIGGEPLFAMRWSTDLPKAWDEAKKNPELQKELDDSVRELRDEWGIDIEGDLVKNLGGDISFVVTKAPKGGEIPVEAVAYTPVLDAEKANNLLDVAGKKLRDNGMNFSADHADGEHWYFAGPGAVGVAKSHLILAGGAGRMESLRRSLKGGVPSYLDALPAEVKSGLVSGPPLYAWLDLARSKEIVDQFQQKFGRAAPQDATEAVDALDDLLSGISFAGDASAEAITLESKAYAGPGGFTAAFAKQAEQMRIKSMRAEVPGNVDGIKTAELSYDAAFDTYVPCGSETEARAAMTKEPHEWVPAPCWTQLGWRPDGKVRGGYWVTVDPWGSRFEVHGVIDADGDGIAAEYVASNWRNASLVTPADEY